MSCPNHDDAACCTACTSGTDGLGFPHPSEAKGRRRLQQCSFCKNWIEPAAWLTDVYNAIFCCTGCAPHQYAKLERRLEGLVATATPGKRKKLASALDDLRKRSRRLVIGR
jgi:hypothetical protein